MICRFSRDIQMILLAVLNSISTEERQREEGQFSYFFIHILLPSLQVGHLGRSFKQHLMSAQS